MSRKEKNRDEKFETVIKMKDRKDYKEEKKYKRKKSEARKSNLKKKEEEEGRET